MPAGYRVAVLNSAAALPHDAVLVHVGPHKTGTSAIQSTLVQVREELTAHSVTYPGKYMAHHQQAMALRQVTHGWIEDAPPIPQPAVWARFAERVASTPGRVVISSEFFAYADADARARLVADIGRDRVQILIGARHPGAMAVSTWQQTLRDGYPVTMEEWLADGFHRPEPCEQEEGFWLHADAAVLAGRWAQQAGLDRVQVLVVDENEPRRLPSAFEQLLGLPTGLLADRTPRQVNRGLTAAEAALLRQILLTLDERLSWAEYTQTMRKGVIRRLLKVRRPGSAEAKPALPGWAAEQAAREGDYIVGRLRDLGVTVIGDLDSLRSVPRASTGEPVTQIPLELAAEAVVGAIAAGTRGDWTLDAPPG
jgi:hypothetical protein